MRALLLLLSTLVPLGAIAEDEPAMWMKSLRLVSIETEAQPDIGLRATLISSEPRFRPCSEFLPSSPPQEKPVGVRIALAIWEEGAVRSVRTLDDVPGPLDRAARCLTEVVQTLHFDDDPAFSDDRRIELVFEPRWSQARLDLVATTDKQRARLDVPDPSIIGHVDLVSISARINSIQPRLTRCMRAARKRNPDLGNRVTVRLRLAQNRDDPEAPEAWLEALTVTESLLGDEEAEVCIVRELERLSWPRPQTKVAQVTWPFLFLD